MLPSASSIARRRCVISAESALLHVACSPRAVGLYDIRRLSSGLQQTDAV